MHIFLILVLLHWVEYKIYSLCTTPMHLFTLWKLRFSL